MLIINLIVTHNECTINMTVILISNTHYYITTLYNIVLVLIFERIEIIRDMCFYYYRFNTISYI